jgi:hypothetical protein
VDHETALRAVNQALGGRTPRGVGRFSSVELRGVDEIRGPGRDDREEPSSLPSGAWELGAMISVALVTLALVLVAWLW